MIFAEAFRGEWSEFEPLPALYPTGQQKQIPDLLSRTALGLTGVVLKCTGVGGKHDVWCNKQPMGSV